MNDRALSPADAQADRIRYVVRQLRGPTPGLSQIPLGLLFASILLLSWTIEGWNPPLAVPVGEVFVLSLALLILAHLVIRKWYTRRFGEVLGGGWKMESRTSKPGEVLFLLVLLGGVFFLETRLDAGLLGDPALLCLAAVFMTSWVFRRRELPHQGKLAMVVIGGIALAHLLSIEGRSSVVWSRALFFLVFVLHAWMDHNLIVRTLPPLAGPALESGDEVSPLPGIEAPQPPRSDR